MLDIIPVSYTHLDVYKRQAYGEDGDVTGEVARRILQNCKAKKETTDTEGTSMKTVILTSFKSDVRAHMLQDLLKNEGIESMLQGEYTAQVLAYIPGMEIKVPVSYTHLDVYKRQGYKRRIKPSDVTDKVSMQEQTRIKK